MHIKKTQCLWERAALRWRRKRLLGYEEAVFGNAMIATAQTLMQQKKIDIAVDEG